ncbi:uncharacterized protein LOC142972594 [Anticarsia gemmatalis]|uniref:uncharacterized protein LOC142972594 n=1 Tax=Anticarsia gemmatalis TaxID=129554 RepID=UPI003F767F57
MASSDSMFLVEIIVEDLKSYVKCKDFVIKSNFADVFSIVLRDPKEIEDVFPKMTRKHTKRKTKVRRNSRSILNKPSADPKMQTGQSILFVNNVETLIANMQKYPMELSLWSKRYPEYKIASTNIAWSSACIDFLKQLDTEKESEPACMKGEYNVFDEYTSKRMAVITLNMKLSYLKDKITTQFRSLSEEKSNTFVYTGFNSKPSTVLSTIPEKPFNFAEGTGIIKTIYSRGRKKSKKPSSKAKKPDKNGDPQEKKTDEKDLENINSKTNSKKVNSSIMSLVKSDADIDRSKQVDLLKIKSCSSMHRDHLNILNYIFGDNTTPFGNQVYTVGYFTVENDQKDSPKSSRSTPKSDPDSGKSTDISLERYKVKLCDRACVNKEAEPCNFSVCSLDIPKGATDMMEVVKCRDVSCAGKVFREPPEPPDDRVLIDLANLKNECCQDGSKLEKVEEVVGGMKANLKMGPQCYCECECRFGFTKKTTYCKICGGYEKDGEEFAELRNIDLPYPCPIYHKIDTKAKASYTGSDTKKASRAKSAEAKSNESERDIKKNKKVKKDEKFKFNYGYTGIPPHIGHDYCAFPCTGHLGRVPRRMGWLWTCEDVPGMKFRPLWKPGAVNKHVLRLLRMARNPGESFAKKKRKKDMGKGKRGLKRPLLVVHKKEGEYTVTMETMKTYAKPRAVNQVPYEDKPALTYTIGRTEEENRERRLKKERAHRRLERKQREFIQSAFTDVCKDICMKTYQQALGILPDTEDPDCTCYPAQPGPDRTDLDQSCSCSEDTNLSSLDTDEDEWIVEFTPPTAKFDPTFKSKKVTLSDNSSQYSYLDYRVKLLDRYGNPVPRFFKGPDGREQCSDLGGFWSPAKTWLEINVDGYVAPDGRWAPNNFTGPNGETVEGELGKFQSSDGNWLVVGIDGYVDCNNHWRYYPARKGAATKKRRPVPVAGDKKKEKPSAVEPSEATWSCFGDASPKHLSRMGIMGHGHDRKLLLDTLKKLIAQGEDVTIPQPSVVPRMPQKKGKGKQGKHTTFSYSRSFYEERTKCKHPTPSDKGIVAVDEAGNKTYFRLKDYHNKRPKQRIATLTDQGISLSSFHVPCFHSFINREVMKKQQRQHLDALSALAKSHH